MGSPCPHHHPVASVAGRDKLWGPMDIWSDPGWLLLHNKNHTVGAAGPEPLHEGLQPGKCAVLSPLSPAVWPLAQHSWSLLIGDAFAWSSPYSQSPKSSQI